MTTATSNKRSAFTKNDIRKIHEDMDAALKPVLKKHGLDIGRGSKISYTSNSFKFTAEVGMIGETGFAETKEANAYRQLATLYGMDPNWLFKKLRLFTDDVVTIIGLNTRARKMPVIVQKEDGKKYKFSEKNFKGAKLFS